MPDLRDARRILLTVDHRDIGEAFVADLVDLIPVVGEFTSFVKGQDAARKGERVCSAALTGDIFVADLLPANLVCLLLREGRGHAELLLPK